MAVICEMTIHDRQGVICEMVYSVIDCVSMHICYIIYHLRDDIELTASQQYHLRDDAYNC